MPEDQVTALALKLKFVTPEQVEGCKKLQGVLSENGFPLSIPEILVKKEFLTTDQIRVLNITAGYNHAREEDQAMGSFIVKNGFLPGEKVMEALAAQEAIYNQGKPFPRLQEILVQKGFLKPEQLQIILRARMQIEQTKAALKSPSASTPPAGAPAIRPPASIARRPAPTPLVKKPGGGGILADGCKVAIRKTTLKEAVGGERTIIIVDVEGMLDGHTFKPFDEFINAMIDEGGNSIILNCERLDYVSSAGIGVLAGCVKRCRDAKGDLRLSAVQDKVKKIINLVGLQSMMRIYDIERGAVMSFKYT